MQLAPNIKDVVLLGGGHSHIEVLRAFRMKPVEGSRVTIISKDINTPYSGMLPGYISGFYNYDDFHIDLRKLSNFKNSRVIQAKAINLDIKNKYVILKDRPSIKYDYLSIDIGITPNLTSVPGSKEYTIPVKPISEFNQKFSEFLQNLKNNKKTKISVAIVGGGAGGLELALATHFRLNKEFGDEKEIQVYLVTKNEILYTSPNYIKKQFRNILKEKKIKLYENSSVVSVTKNALNTKNQKLEFDQCLWCTEASAENWLINTQLETDKDGFILINDKLQASPEVFATGDVATSLTDPRPKAGVFAVRQGPVLAKNIRHSLLGEALESFRPQKSYLSLISTGDKDCYAIKGWFGFRSRYLWYLKDYIDSKFIKKYSINTAQMMTNIKSDSIISENENKLFNLKMRCAGCGGKIGWNTLEKVLRKIKHLSDEEKFTSEDAAIVDIPEDNRNIKLLQTNDFLKSFITDPYLFGQLTANHCLSDIYAMGSGSNGHDNKAKTALATVMIPYASESIVEQDLYQMMSGAVKVLNEHNCELIGGHTSEGSDLALGFSIEGIIEKDNILRKGGMQKGDCLILTKALGIGTLLAAAMENKAKNEWIENAIEEMMISNKEASEILVKYKATSCTDVTGYGLIGHLSEMTDASKALVEINVDNIKVIKGADICLQEGIFSTIQESNLKFTSNIKNLNLIKNTWKLNLLTDPQTSGGLLASIPEENSKLCLNALKNAGYKNSEIIGHVKSHQELDTNGNSIIVNFS